MSVNATSIVMYHYVRPIKGSRHPLIRGLEIDAFRRQLDYLTHEFNIVSAEDVIGHVKNGSDLPMKSCLLTFDDGYKDHFLYAFPELRRRNLKGCFFPSAKSTLDRDVLDVNKIHFILSEQPDVHKLVADLKSTLLCRADRIGDVSKSSFEDCWNAYSASSRYDNKEVSFLKAMLQRILPCATRSAVLDELFRRHVSSDPEGFSAQLYMSLEELRQLVNDGMYVGSHGYSHVWLGEESNERQGTEIDLSLKFLAEIGAATSNWIMCYPYGSYNDETLRILRSRDCALGFTTSVGEAALEPSRVLELPRFDTNDFPQ
jgi:peptidoglycan/xylan/chitin deacetylase (PgdA/CDA1 family)